MKIVFQMYDKWNLKRIIWFHATKIIYCQKHVNCVTSSTAKIRNVSTNESLSNKSKNILNEI